MIFFRRKKNEDKKDIEKDIRNLSEVFVPGGTVKKRIKTRLMAAINDSAEMKEYARIIEPVKLLAENTIVPKELKFSLRRRLMNRISLDLGSYSWFAVFGRGVFNRASVAAVMIFVVSFVSVFTFQFAAPVSYAKDSVLYNVEGDVYVYRAGMLLPAGDGFLLHEGDKIHTGYGAAATAVFMDDTVSRISEESKLNLSRLLREESTGVTEVVLGIAQGRVWSRVPSLISGSFSVATLHTVARAQRNATFDVNVRNEDEVAISVVENFVDVELSSYSPAVKTTVTRGESLVVDNERNTIVSLDNKDAWLRMNISKDEFESQLLAQQDVSDLENIVGVLPTDRMYGVKTFKENLGVVLGINQREKLSAQLAIAEKRLAEAEVLLNKGLSGNAEEVLKEYKQIMLEITGEYDSLIGIEEVRTKLDAMIARDKRRYYTTLPGSSLYDVKRVVKEVEFLLANDRIRANQIALNNASDDLYQVFDLLERGGSAIAEVSISNYPIVLRNTLYDLNVYYQDDKDGYIRAALETALSDLKTINALHDSFGDTENLDIFGPREQIIEVLNEYFAIFNYEDLLAEFEILQSHDFDKLVLLSEFIGVSDQNAATVDIALIESEPGDAE